MAVKTYNTLEIIERIDEEIGEDIQRVAVAILSSVVVATPVGNPTLWQNPTSAPEGYVGGHARRNWQVSLGATIQGVRGVEGRGPGKNAASQESLAAGRAQIERVKPSTRRIVIQNNVPYIGLLNDGHSTQAPTSFIETAVMVGRNIARNERKDLP